MNNSRLDMLPPRLVIGATLYSSQYICIDILLLLLYNPLYYITITTPVRTEEENNDCSKKLTKFLENLDLLEGEVEVYLHLLSSGEKTASNIVRDTDIPRASVDRYLIKLEKKRLISEVIRNTQKFYKANSPERFEIKLKEKEVALKKEMKKVEDMQTVFPSFLKELYAKQSGDTDDSSVSITVYKGKDEVWKLYEEMMKASEYYSFSDYERYYEIFPDTKKAWVGAYKSNEKRVVKDIVVSSKLAKEIMKNKHERCLIKLLPLNSFKSSFVFADYIIFDNKVAIVQLNPENIVATVISSKSFAESLKLLHISMWNFISD